MRLPITVFSTKIAEISAARMIAILQELPCFIGSPGTKVHTQHWFGPSRSAPFNEFIRAEPVRLPPPPPHPHPHPPPSTSPNTPLPIPPPHKPPPPPPANARPPPPPH